MVEFSFQGRDFVFETHPALFSPRGVDRGTLALLSCVSLEPPARLIDLGCGWGVVGIVAARFLGPEHVVMLDCDPLAVEYSRRNAAANGLGDITVLQSEGLAALPDTGYNLLLSNPPYQSDFSVAKGFIEKGFNRLALGGRLFMVTKRRLWYENRLRAVFGGVKVREIDGYFVFESEKRDFSYANTKKRPARREMG